MIETPPALQSKFEELLQDKAIPDNLHRMYQKWLRFYLDFCKKYHVPPKCEKSLPPFIEKLRDKQQSQAQQEQAIKTVNLYYELLNEMGIPYQAPLSRPAIPPGHAPLNDKKQSAIDSAPTTTVSPEPQSLISSASVQAKPITGGFLEIRIC